LAGATFNTAILGTQQDRRHKSVHRDTANAATKHVTQDAHVKIFPKTRSWKNKKQHAVRCNYVHIEVNGSKSTVQHTVGVLREQYNQFIADRKGKPSWSTKAVVHIVRKIDHQDVISSGILTDEFPDKHPCEGTKQGSFFLEETTEA
jgi:hypothetical protein